MSKTHMPGVLTPDRPAQQPQNSASSQPARRGASCLHAAAAAGENAGRHPRVESMLKAGQLTIRSQRDGMTHTIAVFGELDAHTARLVDDELKAVEATDAQQIVLDLAGLTFMDSSGVHLIARAVARCSAAVKRLTLLPGAPCVQRVFTPQHADTLPFAA